MDRADAIGLIKSYTSLYGKTIHTIQMKRTDAAIYVRALHIQDDRIEDISGIAARAAGLKWDDKTGWVRLGGSGINGQELVTALNIACFDDHKGPLVWKNI